MKWQKNLGRKFHLQLNFKTFSHEADTFTELYVGGRHWGLQNCEKEAVLALEFQSLPIILHKAETNESSSKEKLL